jgi:hypothetical protein
MQIAVLKWGVNFQQEKAKLAIPQAIQVIINTIRKHSTKKCSLFWQKEKIEVMICRSLVLCKFN